MAKGDIVCDSCKGERLRKALTGYSPCFECNGMGKLKANGKPYREWEVIEYLLAENWSLRKQNHLLKKMPTESAEQHDGLGKNRYRGD